PGLARPPDRRALGDRGSRRGRGRGTARGVRAGADLPAQPHRPAAGPARRRDRRDGAQADRAERRRERKREGPPAMSPAEAAPPPMSLFERYLSVWVALCIAAGLALGSAFPPLFEALAGLEVASVNLPVAVLIWAMIYPMMVAVDFASLRQIGERPKGLAITVAINWLVKPFTMAALAVLFFDYLYSGLIAENEAQQYIAGLILLGAAPCTAMVFVWSQLTRGDPAYPLVQVSVNDVIMVFSFAPLVALLLGVT